MRNHYRFLFILTILCASAVFLTGCMVGPNYQPPKSKVPATWGEVKPANDSTSVKSIPAVDQAPLAKWWTTLEDPLLNSLIERAVVANPDLRIAHARVREARAQRGIAVGDLWPTVNVSSSYQRNRSSGNLGFSQSTTGGSTTTSPFLEGDLFQVGFDSTWEIDIFGGKRREIEAANADLQAEIENRRDVLVTLLAEVARNYVELRSAQRQSAIARANLQAQEETLKLTRIRFDAGLVRGLDVSRAEAQVQTTAAEIPSLEITARQSIHLLSILLAQEPNALSQELTAESPIPTTPSVVPIALPSDLLRRRPDVRRVERQIAAATARIGVATADLFPKFSLTGSIGLSSNKLSNLADSGSRFWSIIPGVTWPVFDFGKIRSNIAVQDAREEQAFVTYEQTVLNSLREVEDAIVSYSENQVRRQSLANAVQANRRSVELANQLYSHGMTDFLDVLQVQRDLFAAEDSLAESDRDVSADFVALYKALGGGWEIEESTPTAPTPGKAGDRTLDVSGVTKN